jgi:hypothetical protein
VQGTFTWKLEITRKYCFYQSGHYDRMFRKGGGAMNNHHHKNEGVYRDPVCGMSTGDEKAFTQLPFKIQK